MSLPWIKPFTGFLFPSPLPGLPGPGPIWPWLSLQAPGTPSLISLCWPGLKLLISARSFLHTLLGWLSPFFQVFSPMSFFRETFPDHPISSSPHPPWGAVTVWLTHLSVHLFHMWFLPLDREALDSSHHVCFTHYGIARCLKLNLAQSRHLVFDK